ncbi:galactokinase [Petrotoga olearia]|uniref:Galactokinase n=2 Tax=Petrotoga olearia TaxID=156203 RepID=A0A2K1P4F9_9BACT|nr:galactokinase [Petrotoga olearia]KUK15636.1 MAG: Galactokinase [Petrotoga mobilis]PNR97646.1 galactokinase [Petrotoga olearia DSM 13574]RMA75393.1 galactokinase [Petrotoga olearia]
MDLLNTFQKIYGESEKPVHRFFSPGRINLIGEHIDYNGGYVLPVAINLGINGLMNLRNDNFIYLKSMDFPNEVKVDLNAGADYRKEDGWGNYAKGVIKFLLEDGFPLKGCNILIKGELPNGAGLSSSAALEVLIGFMLLSQNQIPEEIDRTYLALLGQRVENKFIGVNSGIMDQFVIANAKKDQALLLDTQNLTYEYIPCYLNGYSLIIMNTNKRRELASSQYNQRRKECENALEKINQSKETKADNLCQCSVKDLKYLDNEIELKRARHVITENQRVIQASKLLKNNDIEGFGALLIQSHNSLKNDYEVTGFELDTIVDEALKIKGCVGARMTGAGFGGCAIALVEKSQAKAFKEQVFKNYYEKTKIEPSLYETTIEDGVKILKN